MHHPKCDVKSSNLCIKIGSCIWFAVVKHIDGETRIIFNVEFPSLAFVLKILYGQKEVGTKIYKGMTLWCYFCSTCRDGLCPAHCESFNSRQLARKGVAVWCGAQFKMGFYGLFFHRSTQFHGSSCGSCLTFFWEPFK